MTTTGTASRSPEQIQQVIDAVRRRFPVTQEYIREGEALEFYIDPNEKNTKSNFLSLVAELRQTGDTAVLRRTDHGLLMMVFRKQVRPRAKLTRPLILLLAAIVTIFADGLIRATGYQTPLPAGLEISGIYAISLLGIIGIHEMGHKLASWYHGMDSSWPYFIPGVPGVLPTLGAVINSREPPANKDSLFDLGLSGPVAGLLVTVIVSIIAVGSSVLVPASSFPPTTQFSTTDYYTSWLVSILKNPSANDVITGTTFNLLYFAYSIGFLITFVNLLPAWQLDGGHVANSAVSPKVHRLLTYLSVVIMFLTNFWIMGFLVLILSRIIPPLRPLDDVSPLSTNRKVLFALTWVLSISIYAFAIYNNSYFGLNSLFSR